MPLGARKMASTAQNGLKNFILPLRRLDFHYCDWAGSSRGMNAFLKHTLPSFAAAHPQIEIHVSPRPRRHPVVRGHFLNGREKAVCVRNMEVQQILDRVELLRDNSGEKTHRERKKVRSVNDSVRGIWSPYHSAGAAGEAASWKI